MQTNVHTLSYLHFSTFYKAHNDNRCKFDSIQITSMERWIIILGYGSLLLFSRINQANYMNKNASLLFVAHFPLKWECQLSDKKSTYHCLLYALMRMIFKPAPNAVFEHGNFFFLLIFSIILTKVVLVLHFFDSKSVSAAYVHSNMF